MKLNHNSVSYGIATVEDLELIESPLEGDTVVVTEEGRGGVFIYRADGTSNGGTIFDSSSTGKWHRQYEGSVNVKWFGAKGDGVTSDSTAINLALSLGGQVYFPEGIYIINERLYPVSNSLIYGEGTSSKLKLINNFGSQIDMFTLSGKEFITFKDLYLDGNLSGQTFVFDNGQNAICLKTTPSNDVVVDNVYFINFGKDGVYVGEASYNIKVVNCTFDTMRRIGVTITSGKNIIVSNNIFQNGKDLVNAVSNTGVHFEPNSSSEILNDLIIDSNIFKDMKSGITLFNNAVASNIKDVIISNNTLNNITVQAAIVDYYVPNVTIVGNSIYGCGDINGTNFNSNAGGAIVVRNAPYCNITGNTFVNNKGGYGTISVYAAGFCTINGNSFTGCQRNSIFCSYLYGGDDPGVGGAGRIITNNMFYSGSLFAVGTYEAIKTTDYPTHFSVADVIENNYCRVSPSDSYSGFMTTYYLPVVRYNRIYNNGGFYFSGLYSAGQRFITQSSAAPTTGTYIIGDYVLNNNPTGGGFLGWICTDAGTPGTWKTFGAITA